MTEDWVGDESLSRDEVLERFEALEPEKTHGPRRRINIDPNRRIDFNHTFVFLDYEDSDDLKAGMKVTAVEPEGGLKFPARVVRRHEWSKSDDHDVYVELEVEWGEMTFDD